VGSRCCSRSVAFVRSVKASEPRSAPPILGRREEDRRMTQPYAEQIEALHESLEHDREDLQAAIERMKRAVKEPLAVQRRIRERPTPWVFGAALVGLWLGARVTH